MFSAGAIIGIDNLAFCIAIATLLFSGVLDAGLELAVSAALVSTLICRGRCCRALTVEDSHCESMRLDMLYEQAVTRPLPHDELVQLHFFAPQARFTSDLAGQGDDLACAA